MEREADYGGLMDWPKDIFRARYFYNAQAYQNQN